MPNLWIALFALAAAAPSEEPLQSPEQASSQPTAATRRAAPEESSSSAAPGDLCAEKLKMRTGRKLLSAVRETLARLAHPEDDELEAAAEELLFVYAELQEDRELATSYRDRYLTKVERRLQDVSGELQKRIARNKRTARRKPPQRIRGHDEVDNHLDQRGGRGAPPRAGRMAAPRIPNPAAGRGRVPNDDYGQHLVDLIQKTIAPSTWDVNGGLGTIYYWRPGRALVVRQTGEVHHQMGGLLQQLRRAGP